MTNPVHPERQGPRFSLPDWTWRQWLEAVILLGLAPLFAVSALIVLGLGNRWVDLAAQFTAPLLLAALAGTAILALLRLRRAAVAGLAVVGLLAIAVWPQWFPASTTPDPDAPIVRLYSANLYYLNNDTARIRRSIEAADADIVVLIELASDPALNIDQLLAGYPHRAASMRLDQTRGPSRSVIASRWPLTVRADPPDGLHAVAATVRTPLGPLNVVGVHLTRPWPFQHSWGQISQTMALDAVVEGMDGPVVVAGDFNSVSSARIGRQVRRDIGLRPAPGFPGTWPSDLPSALGMNIDQVYASPDLGFVSRRLGSPTGSDHRPVVTEITRAAD
ncbi:endonuclease/exonuclease/phosphatase family protein [Brevundimonas sp.]|uniref:endonuclease/exonuclease/phosphatase family protein n=1 Tax=Brevundimonas sp. TaxID=1871086 RepID=UPI00122334F9|nr:endonuclease/exonuclease/phosphatase family protein [Brevundimonas sp.]TAJ66969.1 MAG: endonuclease [Brevundimonas sp.]